ncbi:MAG: PD-(D/E)XK nuclease family protein [Verrucomicrobiae bacterium]|nr:PD-(D/E)XK nuclease family protein [Verrucomicrobiae bacterium]
MSTFTAQISGAPYLRLLDPPSEPPRERSTPSPDAIADLKYVSASRLKCWQTCRRQYYYRYVHRIEVPLAPTLYIGTQVHEVLKRWNLARWRGEEIGPDELWFVFCQNWDQDQLGQNIAWKHDNEEQAAKQQAWSMLDRYFAECPVAADENPQGVEVQIECDLSRHGLPPLLGYIDLVRGNGRIVELKTQARQVDPVMLAHQHETQLACYALAYRSATGMRESGFEIHSLIKTKEPQIQVTLLDPMSPAQETALYRLMDAFQSGLEHEEWIKSPGQHCGWCDHFDRCHTSSTSGL